MIVEREGEPGRTWIDQLPATVAGLLEKWELHQDGPPLYGMCAVVLRVRTANGGRGALKVGWIDDETRAESLALQTWAGRGAVSVLRSDEASGAMLLERLDEQRTLHDVPIEQALDIAAAILKDLRVPAVAGLRSTSDTAARWSGEFLEDWERLGRPCDEALLTSAVQLCKELSVPPAEPSLLHGDFHYANILGRGEDGWAAIDPKPQSGDPAYEVVPLLRNRWSEIRGGDATNATVERRMERFAEVAVLDLATTYKWCLVRSVDDALWFQENGYADLAEISWDIARSMFESL
ncbi:aminoglycoside phosphotransferase family protein [Micromonospora sp. R77]|uniref:aminoglycoside phosphotransferase family protein n=1 Tax=Micromonospora sp. R77 TaxID=2925836 RepID=UPI001F61A22D|nr:aminoglycoside phosphotransferase family protein [Micromonospora sp. R77]MCI4066792.1 aminoglycoside phosphotransferase family protein [Micromonospora sp. R77]